MEITTSYTSHEDLAEATRGYWGKDVGKDFSLVYFGQAVIGQADNSDILEKECKCAHYRWVEIGNNTYLAILK